MSDLNSVILIGRLTRDAELKYTQTGTAICNFSVAVNKTLPPRDGDGGEWKTEVSFFDVTLWGKVAEGKAKYLTKGKQVCVSGELVQDRWTDKETGKERSRVKITAKSVQLLADPKGKGGQVEGQQAGDDWDGKPNAGEQAGAAGYEFEDEIPF